MNTTVGLQMNMRQLLNVLSSSLYKGDILSVATRELLQNSFDAVKKISDPKIQVNFDNYKRTLEFKDNGIGMSPETVKDVFLTIGGTAKEGLDETERSGGFGIAKVQFFTAAEHILVESVRDGIKTIIDTTREDLIDQRAGACTEECGGGGHAVSDLCGDGDGGSHDRQELLKRKDDQLARLGTVMDVINQVF